LRETQLALRRAFCLDRSGPVDKDQASRNRMSPSTPGGIGFTTFGGFAPPFGGVVDIFDYNGNLLTPNHFAANLPGAGPLTNPWAITRAPANFGQFSNAILIGNVEDGKINAFSESGEFLGPLLRSDNTTIVIPGLWDLDFAPGNRYASPGPHLYFTAGPDVADFCGNGLFGFISAARGR
jgi:uncharacterized protein (TIGR03118 family)